ncbi:hypothetical protein ACHAXT_004976 [Thalassiosira profunda]
MTMPTPNPKRRRSDDGASQPLAKRGPAVAAAPFAAAAASTSPGLVSTSTSSAPKSNATSRGRLARQRQFLNGMGQLNYGLYSWAKKQQQEGPSADGFYLGITELYQRHAQELSRKYHRAYGDTATFGDGDCGQLGCGEAVTESRKPRTLASLRGREIEQVASGGLHSLALDVNGRVYSWGCNDEGSLGWLATEEKEDGAIPDVYGPNGVTGDMLDANSQLIPFEQRPEAVITQIAAGETQSMALSTAGDVYMWGTYKDDEGRKFRNMPPQDDTRTPTGNKDMNNLEEDDDPIYYQPPRGNQDWPLHLVQIPQKATAVSAGGAFCAVLLEDGSLVTFGVGNCGELARPTVELNKKTPIEKVKEDYLTPKPPLWEQPTLKRDVLNVSCGAFHLLVVAKENGARVVYSAGLNQYGQLGLGDEERRGKLTRIPFFDGKDIATVEGGYHFSCFVDDTGTELYATGRGDYGQLGITLEQPGSGWFVKSPCRVPLVYEPKGPVANPKENCINAEDIVEEDQPEIEQISCGSTHVLVLTKGGDAYSWGFGTSGACGQGKEDSDVLRPRKLEAKVKGAPCQMRYLSGGGQHSTAIVTTGSKGFTS